MAATATRRCSDSSARTSRRLPASTGLPTSPRLVQVALPASWPTPATRLKVEVQIPQRFEQMPPQLTGMVYDIPCLQSTGGTIVYYPMSVVFCDGL